MKHLRFLGLTLLFITLLTIRVDIASAANGLTATSTKPDAGELMNSFFEFIESQSKFAYDNLLYVYVQDLKKKKATYATVSNAKGNEHSVVGTTGKSYRNSGTIETYAGDEEESVEKKLTLVSLDDSIYVMINTTQVKGLKGKWIRIPYDTYDDFAKGIDEEDLFKQARATYPNEEDRQLAKITANLIKKYDAYQYYGEPEVVKINGKKLLRYTLEPNKKTLVAYYTEFAKSLTDEQRKNSIFAQSSNFEEQLKNKSFVDYIATNSFVNIFLDMKTGQTVAYYEEMILPIFKPVVGTLSAELHIIINNSMDLTKKQKKVKIPSNSKNVISAEEALRIWDAS